MTNGNWKDEKMQFCIKYKSKFEHEVILKQSGLTTQVSLKTAPLKDTV